jgi:hypothetical protein
MIARLHVWSMDPSVSSAIALSVGVGSSTASATSARALKGHPRIRTQSALRDIFRSQLTPIITNYYFNALKGVPYPLALS